MNNDPFQDVRDKRIGELNEEQTDRATELWLRTQIGPGERFWYPHLQALFRVIDRLRAENEALKKPLSEQQIVNCLAAAGCLGTVRMSYESGASEITRPTINAEQLVRLIKSAHIEAAQAVTQDTQ
jgi:hypothetical protein